MSILLTQQEADALLALDKQYVGDKLFFFPSCGGEVTIPLTSADRREEFLLDVSRSRIKLTKHTFQSRARKSVVLARIDLDGPPHRNPDGAELPCPHLHLYREGFGDKWAMPLPNCFTCPDDSWQTLNEFMDYCHVATKGMIDRELFT